MCHFCQIPRKIASLLPCSVDDRLPRNHPARFIIEASASAATGQLNQSALAEISQ